jgi:hypothetical protein
LLSLEEVLLLITLWLLMKGGDKLLGVGPPLGRSFGFTLTTSATLSQAIKTAEEAIILFRYVTYTVTLGRLKTIILFILNIPADIKLPGFRNSLLEPFWKYYLLIGFDIGHIGN